MKNSSKSTNLIERFFAGGLSSTQIKTIALLAMTLDHIGAYCFIFPLVARYQVILRTIGRIAAPLFLYCVSQSIKHTNSKLKYLARMYFAAVITGACNLLVGHCLDISFTNIYHSYVWVIVVALLLDKASQFWHSGIRINSLLIVGFTSCIIMAASATQELTNSLNGRLLDLIDVIFLSVEKTEYSSVFVMLGVVWYFCEGKALSCIILLALGCLSFFTPASVNQLSFICGEQWAIILATPIIALYNGERGRKCKEVFYFYYPVHKYLLAIAAKIFV